MNCKGKNIELRPLSISKWPHCVTSTSTPSWRASNHPRLGSAWGTCAQGVRSTRILPAATCQMPSNRPPIGGPSPETARDWRISSGTLYGNQISYQYPQKLLTSRIPIGILPEAAIRLAALLDTYTVLRPWFDNATCYLLFLDQRLQFQFPADVAGYLQASVPIRRTGT